jgi:hypothetical protein
MRKKLARWGPSIILYPLTGRSLPETPLRKAEIMSAKKKTLRTVRVNGETFEVDIAGLRPGDTVRGVGEQCEGCGSSLDAESPAELGAARATVCCPECKAVYALENETVSS